MIACVEEVHTSKATKSSPKLFINFIGFITFLTKVKKYLEF